MNIKQLLSGELEKEDTDHDKILFLASQLAREDQSNVRFSVDADHINRLGVELVARQETALSEIIKNAYDADSTKIDLIFKTETGGKQSLVISDNGTGMSRKQLIDGFMRISTADKKNNPRSEVFGRLRAGKKGIGRFAAQRLGSKLTVITKREKAEKFLVVKIDWEKFSTNQDLITISSRVEEHENIPYEFESSGTILVVDDLREEWTEAKIKRSYRYAAELLLPFPISKTANTPADRDTYVPDPGFEAVFKRQKQGLKPEVVVDSGNIYLEHSFAVITGKIDNSGNAFWRVESKFLDYDSGWRNYKVTTYKEYSEAEKGQTASLKYNALSNVHFTAHYFIPNTLTHYPKNLTSVIQEALRQHGGIRLYRNGFRVLPYGERYDDWLRLDWYTRNRFILPPVGNNNFFGVVEISPETTGDFEEVASREGLITNDSFNELREFVSASILSAVVEINFARKIKVFAGQPGYVPTPKSNDFSDGEKEEFVKEKINKWKEEVSGPHHGGTNSNGFDFDSPENEEKLGIDRSEFEQFAEFALELIDKTELYRVLAGLGLAMAEFTHEVKFNLVDLLLMFQSFKPGLNEQQMESFSKVESRVDRLRGYTAFFEESFQSLANKELQVLDLRELINDFVEILDTSSIKGKDIQLEVSHDGYEFFSKPSHRSNIDSILVNLYSNAKKAIYRKSSQGRILITVKENNESIELLFSDTGDGVPDNLRDKIFHPFFTTNTQEVSGVSETSQMLGMGLGLAIVKEIVDGLDGDIELVEPVESFSTTFKITLPKAEDKDIPDDIF